MSPFDAPGDAGHTAPVCMRARVAADRVWGRERLLEDSGGRSLPIEKKIARRRCSAPFFTSTHGKP